MKRTILLSILAVAQFSMAAGPAKRTVDREHVRKEVVKLLGSEDQTKIKSHITEMSKRAALRAGLEGHSEFLRKAIDTKDESFIVIMTEATLNKDKETLEFLAKASRAVGNISKSEKVFSSGTETQSKAKADAKAIADIAQIDPAVMGPSAAKFKAEVVKAIEGGKTVTEAIKAASIAIDKTGKDEITAKKIEELCT